MCPNILDGRDVLRIQPKVAKKNGARYWVRTSDPHRVKQRKSSAFRVIVSQIRSRSVCMCQFQRIRGPLLSFAPHTPTRTAVVWFSEPIAPRRGCGAGVNSRPNYLTVLGYIYEAFCILALVVTHFVLKHEWLDIKTLRGLTEPLSILNWKTTCLPDDTSSSGLWGV